MPVNNVSFGTVVAVFGNPNKVNDIHKELTPHARLGKVMIKDVTKHYRNSCSGGLMEEAAKRGDRVELYITRGDIQKINNKKRSWNSIEGILSNLGTFFQVDKRTPVSVAVSKILNS